MQTPEIYAKDTSVFNQCVHCVCLQMSASIVRITYIDDTDQNRAFTLNDTCCRRTRYCRFLLLFIHFIVFSGIRAGDLIYFTIEYGKISEFWI